MEEVKLKEGQTLFVIGFNTCYHILMNKINIYGAPGSGLHTFSALLHMELQNRKISSELFRMIENTLSFGPVNKVEKLTKVMREENLRAQNVNFLICEEPCLMYLFVPSETFNSIELREIREELKFQGREFHFFLSLEEGSRYLNVEDDIQSFLREEQVPFFPLAGNQEEQIAQALALLSLSI